MCVTAHLKQPTQEQWGRTWLGQRPACSSIWSCSGWGLPCHPCCQGCGALLPHHFTLTNSSAAGGIFSVALSVGFRLPGVTWHPAHRSPDFPLSTASGSQRLSGQLPILTLKGYPKCSKPHLEPNNHPKNNPWNRLVSESRLPIWHPADRA